MAMSGPDQRLATVAVGVSSGLRTFTVPAVLALRGAWDAGTLTRILPVIAVGEFAGDKHPAIPARTSPPALIGRIISGAAGGGTLDGPGGAALGAATAALSAHASQRLRAAVAERGVPDPLLGAVEDVLAVLIAAWAAGRLAPPVTP